MTPEEARALAEITQELELTRLVVLISMIWTFVIFAIMIFVLRNSSKDSDAGNQQIMLLIDRLGTVSDRLTTLTSTMTSNAATELAEQRQHMLQSTREHERIITVLNLLTNALVGKDLLDTEEVQTIKNVDNQPIKADE